VTTHWEEAGALSVAPQVGGLIIDDDRHVENGDTLLSVECQSAVVTAACLRGRSGVPEISNGSCSTFVSTTITAGFTRHWRASPRSAQPIATRSLSTTIAGDLTAAGCISCLRPRDAQFATDRLNDPCPRLIAAEPLVTVAPAVFFKVQFTHAADELTVITAAPGAKIRAGC
jgi:hypothetical protein